MKFFLFIILAIFALLTNNLYRCKVIQKNGIDQAHSLISTLSHQEKEDLEFFFHYSNFFGPYTYTLIGSRAMSIFDFDRPREVDIKNQNYKRKCEALERGFEVWQKCERINPPKHFLLIPYFRFGLTDVLEIALINPTLCKEVIQDNIEDFRSILGSELTCADIFEILTHPENKKFSQLTENDRLLGILLGFGSNNSYFFEQRMRDQIPNSSIGNSNFHYWFPLPAFACNIKAQETRELIKKYKEARKCLRWTYFGKSELEVTLALLYSDRPPEDLFKRKAN